MACVSYARCSGGDELDTQTHLGKHPIGEVHHEVSNSTEYCAANRNCRNHSYSEHRHDCVLVRTRRLERLQILVS